VALAIETSTGWHLVAAEPSTAVSSRFSALAARAQQRATARVTTKDIFNRGGLACFALVRLSR
jgi:hypothetical protein